jgi:outer membrane lipoprotein SlyB
VLGNAIERSSNREEALEIVVRLADGDRRAVVQAKGVDVFRPGDAVSVVSSGGRARVTPVQRTAAEGS